MDDDRQETVETAVRAYKSGNMLSIEDMAAHDQYRRMRPGHVDVALPASNLETALLRHLALVLSRPEQGNLIACPSFQNTTTPEVS